MSTTRRKRLLAITAALAFGAIVVTGTAVFVEAQARQVSPVQFAMTGITADQTARLTVSALTTDGSVCRATLSFVDADGDDIVTAAGEPAKKNVMLTQGASDFLDVTLQGGLQDTRRSMLRPMVVILSRSADACLPQLEIIDNATQRTVILNPGIVAAGWGANNNETLLRVA